VKGRAALAALLAALCPACAASQAEIKTALDEVATARDVAAGSKRVVDAACSDAASRSVGEPRAEPREAYCATAHAALAEYEAALATVEEVLAIARSGDAVDKAELLARFARLYDAARKLIGAIEVPR
jgi:hypothetical protein